MMGEGNRKNKPSGAGQFPEKERKYTLQEDRITGARGCSRIRGGRGWLLQGIWAHIWALQGNSNCHNNDKQVREREVTKGSRTFNH